MFPRRPKPFAVIATLVFAVSALKGLRMPNLWAATHMTFNYSHGFIRRGLFGEALRFVGGNRLYNYNVLALSAVLLFVIVAATMALLIKRVLATDSEDRGLMGAVLAFAASPGLVVFAHLIGYLDYLGLLLTLGVILISARSRHRYLIFVLAAPVGCLLALVHESLVLMFAPTILFAMICHTVIQLRKDGSSRRARFLLTACTSAAFVGAFVASTSIGVLGTKSPALIGALQASIAPVANFPLRGDAFEALYRPVRDNLFTLMPWFWRNPENQRYLALGFISAFPGIAFLTTYGVRLIGCLGLSKVTRTVMTVAFVAATLAPLSLNFMGWDSARWNAISLIAAFCCIAIIRLFFSSQAPIPPGHRVDSPVMLTLAAVAVVLGLCSTNYSRFLFDGYVTQWFPFDGQLSSLIDLFRGHFTFIPRY